MNPRISTSPVKQLLESKELQYRQFMTRLQKMHWSFSQNFRDFLESDFTFVHQDLSYLWYTGTPLYCHNCKDHSTFSGLIKLENPYISMRLGLTSTLIRWAFSSKTHRFENALESGSKRKRIRIVLVDGRKSIKMKTMTDNIAGACICSMSVAHNVRHNVQFYGFRTF